MGVCVGVGVCPKSDRKLNARFDSSISEAWKTRFGFHRPEYARQSRESVQETSLDPNLSRVVLCARLYLCDPTLRAAFRASLMNRFYSVANRRRRRLRESFGKHLDEYRVVPSIAAGPDELAGIGRGSRSKARGLSR